MAEASRDENNVPTLLGVSSADGETPVVVYADPDTHRLLVSADGSSTATVNTTNATVTTIATIAIPADTTVLIEANVVARRTGGSSGTAQDGAGYVVYATYKNVAGTATEIGETSMFSAEDQAGWACTINVSGGNALIQVTGAANNNISWVCNYKTISVSS